MQYFILLINIIFYFILIYCGSCRIAVSFAYCTSLSAVQVHTIDSARQPRELTERINEFFDVVVESVSSSFKLALGVVIASCEPQMFECRRVIANP